MGYKFAPGATSVSVYFKLRDSSSGLAKSGLAYNSAGVQASYTRKGGSATTITLASLSTPTSSWTSGGFVEVDSTKAKGLYRLDLPDAALAAGVTYFIVSLTFTGVVEEAVIVSLETPTQTTGAGAITWTIEIRNSNTSLPLEGAAVWVTTDSAGSNVVAGTLQTDNFGHVTFYLDAGQYYVWISDPGYTASNPTSITVA